MRSQYNRTISFIILVLLVLVIALVWHSTEPADNSHITQSVEAEINEPIQQPKINAASESTVATSETVSNQVDETTEPIHKLNDVEPQEDVKTLVEEVETDDFVYTAAYQEQSTVEQTNDVTVLEEEVMNSADNDNTAMPMEVSDAEVELLAKVIWFEAGAEWLSEEWKMSVGEVVLNRVASPEFPNTITEVVYAPGQYACVWRSDWDTKTFTEDDECMKLARRLLAGERLMEPSVVFQSGVVQGSGIYTSYYDSYFGTTYFCHSSYMEHYQ